MGIYLNDFGLPKIPMMNGELDNNRIDILDRKYLSSTIAYTIKVEK